MHLRKRVLATGGAGFLGSFLCERLLQEKCDEVCVDNFYTGTKRNIMHLLDNPFLNWCGMTSPFRFIWKSMKSIILQASISELYGDPTVHPQTEDYWGDVNCVGIRRSDRRPKTNI